MSVIRVKKHEEKYVILQKEILENPHISLKAKGLWAFCMAKPDNWEFRIQQLAYTLKEGKDCLSSAIKELEQFGYCKKFQAKKEKGQFDCFDYEIYETTHLLPPLNEKEKDKLFKEMMGFNKCLPQPGFPVPDCPLAENPPQIRNKTSSSYEEEVRKKKEKLSIPPKIEEKNRESFSLYGKYVKLDDSFYKDLILKHGMDYIHSIIEQMNDYVAAHGKPYKDYNHAMNIWLKKRQDAQKSSKQPNEQSMYIDKTLADKIASRFRNEKTIDVSAVAICFTQFRDAYYKFGEKGFREKVLNTLRKMNLPVTGL